MEKRRSKENYYLDIADAALQRSTCLRRKYGAIVVKEDEIVSTDVIGITYGSLFDATQTMVTKISDGLYQVQVVAWYDNENSYTSQMVRTIKYFAEL